MMSVQKSKVSSLLFTVCFQASSKSAGRMTYLHRIQYQLLERIKQSAVDVCMTYRFFRTACNPAA
jgi:hypothetical protein